MDSAFFFFFLLFESLCIPHLLQCSITVNILSTCRIESTGENESGIHNEATQVFDRLSTGKDLDSNIF